jgi:uncharacterized membrane protein YdjX (TVP38/TMEM64 family)
MANKRSNFNIDMIRQKDLFQIYGKLGIFIAIVFVCICLAHFSGLKSYLEDAARLKANFARMGIWAPVVFTVGTALSILVGLPRLLFCALGGLLFGFVKGFILSQLATIMGAYGVFLFARWGIGRWVASLAASKPHLSGLLNKPTAVSVFLARQLPISSVIISVVLGSSSVKQRDFLIGSIFGFIPQATVATLVGSGLAKTSTGLAFIQLFAAVAALFMAITIIIRLKTRYQKSISP